MNFITSLLTVSLSQVWQSFSANWPLLLLSAAIAAAMKLYVDQQKVAGFLKRHQGSGVVGATAVAVTTPLCSCGTTAVVLGMMANLVSWAPIVAFMVASPLSSPEELVYSASLFGWPFASTFFVASILLGLVGGAIAYAAEARGWLADQARFRATADPEVAAGAEALAPMAGGQDGPHPRPDSPTGPNPAHPRPGVGDFLKELFQLGRKLLLFFLGFAFIGYLLNGLIPTSWVTSLFGSGHIYGVPLAATLGVPLYINTESSLPLVRSFLNLGMSPGATLAFLITGAGTSLGAITGALTIARWRVVGIVVGTLWVGSIIIGYAYNFMLAV